MNKFLDNPDLTLEPNTGTIRSQTEKSLECIANFFGTLNEQKVSFPADTKALRSLFSEKLPTEKTPFEALLKRIFEKALPAGINLPSPGYLAYIPVGSMFETALADFITASINRWPGLYEFSPAFVEIEKSVIRWLCEIMGMPAGSSGILTSGGSLANFTAVYTARINKLPEEFFSGTLYVSDQAHHSVLKAARLAGFPKKCIKLISVDDQCRIQIDELKKTIASDKAQNLKPFLIVGNAGTTNTGAIDDLEELAKICKIENMWFHVDAAWAGAFRLTDHGKKLMNGIERADSITFDPHKALYTSFGSGALLVSDIRTLKKAHTMDAAYLPSDNEDLETMNPSQIGPELSRNVRGLQTWLPLKLHGMGPFKNNMEEKLELTFWATEQLETIPNLAIVTKPQTSIVTFTAVKQGASQEAINKLNKDILAEVNADGRILLSGTTIKDRFVIRLVPFGFRTHKPTVKLALDFIRKAFGEMR